MASIKSLLLPLVKTKQANLTKLISVKFKNIPPAVYYLGVVSFFADVASEAIYPILPFFLMQVLHVGPEFVGALEGFAEAIASLTKVFAGFFSDRLRKKFPIVFLGYLISTCRSFIGLAVTPWQVLMIRFSDRVGKGIRSGPRDALLASYTEPHNRGRIFGFHRGMDHLGATVAPLLASLFLYFMPGEYRMLFLLTFLPGIASLIFIIRAAKEKEPESKKVTSKEKLKFKEAFHLPSRFWYFMFVIFVFTLSNSADAFLILRLRDSGVSEFLIPTLWAGLNLVKMLSSFWGGEFSDRVGAKSSILLGWFIYALAYLVFAYSDSTPFIVFSFLAYGIFFGLTEGPEKVIVTQLAPSALRGTAFGFYHLVVGLGLLPASLLCGYIWKISGPTLALSLGSFLALAGFVLLLPLRLEKSSAT